MAGYGMYISFLGVAPISDLNKADLLPSFFSNPFLIQKTFYLVRNKLYI